MKNMIIWPFLKPLIKQYFDVVIVPEIQALEDKIGNDAVKQVVEAITVAIEKTVDDTLS